uniref:Uncharacterized protein n=1 Tax=Ditylenchus dipsaci TaxID=166011 RepID=A0A915CS75_9BILA
MSLNVLMTGWARTVEIKQPLPGCQSIARILCWKEADVIVPGHGPAFLSPGRFLPVQNPLPYFDKREGRAEVSEMFFFTAQYDASNSKIYSVFLIRVQHGAGACDLFLRFTAILLGTYFILKSYLLQDDRSFSSSPHLSHRNSKTCNNSENSIIVVNTGGQEQISTLSNVLEEQGIHPNQVTHIVITSLGAGYCSNLSLFTNATVYMYNDISIAKSFYAPFRPPVMLITPMIKQKNLIIIDDVDGFLLKYLDLDVKEVEICLTSRRI